MRTLCILIPLLFLAPNAAADHCTTWSTSNPEVTIIPVEGGEIWYIDNDLCQP